MTQASCGDQHRGGIWSSAKCLGNWEKGRISAAREPGQRPSAMYKKVEFIDIMQTPAMKVIKPLYPDAFDLCRPCPVYHGPTHAQTPR